MKVDKKNSIEEVLKKHPEAIDVFNKHRMDCHSCLGATADSLEKGALAHGIDADCLVEEINSLLK